MTAFKLHHSKFYTRHSGHTNGKPHCYRCDEILANDNRVFVTKLPSGAFQLPQGYVVEDGEDEGYEPQDSDYVLMGATCALKAIAGK